MLKREKNVTGILAHVDAGKTTLSEGMLFLSGSIRKFGRVDHKDAFLDTYSLERERGITIFSKQALLSYKNLDITLLDTPGHVDFSAEMERVLQILDSAVLVINGSDGVQGHTKTLWKLLTRYRIPVFLFVNKMDLPGCEKEALLLSLKRELSENCMEFGGAEDGKEGRETLALCSEELLNEYMETGEIQVPSVQIAIQNRRVFPVYFGSALKMQGVEQLLDGMEKYLKTPEYSKEFGARVYKIGRDDTGCRLTYMKITGGSLRVKERICDDEKAEQIRIYNGMKYKNTDVCTAGDVCAVTGLLHSYPGQGLGKESASDAPLLLPIMNYRLVLPEGTDAVVLLRQLKEYMEEEPLLHVTWRAGRQEIQVQLMGNVQLEILQRVIKERFRVDVGFDEGSIVYRETIKAPVIGIGHYEPLKHYAEVHLKLEPGEPGSGLTFASACSEDDLNKNWQRLILTHLAEKEHIGVLTGSPITDMKITLVAGRAHLKHTEGGDFRQATYRAVRHGLMSAQNELLEPYYDFTLEIPNECIGRAMNDLERMCGVFAPPQMDTQKAVLKGRAPVACMQGYASTLASYSKGQGRMYLTVGGFFPCHNTEEIVEQFAYDAEGDLENTADSVFCAHGAGFLVPWQQVRSFAHLEGVTLAAVSTDMPVNVSAIEQTKGLKKGSAENRKEASGYEMDKELEEIFTRTFGPIKTRLADTSAAFGSERAGNREPKGPDLNAGRDNRQPAKLQKNTMDYLLVDGYNVIFAWDELRELAAENLESARNRLMDILSNYQGYVGKELILVFDAYKVKGNPGEFFDYHNIHIVYTKEAETADMYIEKVTHEIGRKHRVTVATSDALEQVIIIGQGAVRISARELQNEVNRVTNEKSAEYLDKQIKGNTGLLSEAIKKLNFSEDSPD